MAKRRVNTEGLNLRRTPQLDPDNIITVLPLAHEVEVLNQPAGQRFVEVETHVGSEATRGFVSADLLRDPVSAPKEALLQEAIKQWLRFRKGTGREDVDPFFRFVGEFWQAIGRDLDGRDREVPWSAAFISFIVRQAGYSGFQFSAAHSTYIRDAKRKRLNGDAAAPFWLFRLSEHKPQLGDFICKRREPEISFDNLPSDFISHCDVVVEMRDGVVRAMGGNVSQSVSITTFALDGNGFLRPEGNVFAVMRNNK